MNLGFAQKFCPEILRQTLLNPGSLGQGGLTSAALQLARPYYPQLCICPKPCAFHPAVNCFATLETRDGG